MTPEKLKARARRLADEVLTQGDMAVAEELVAADCRFHPSASIALHSDNIKRWVAALRQVFPNLYAIVEEEIAEGNIVVQRLTLNGTQEIEFLGIPPAGASTTWQMVSFQRAGPDGKFAEIRMLVDRLEFLSQLGPIPTSSARQQGEGTDGEESEWSPK